MAIDLVTKFQPHVDEMFKAESKLSLLTNNDFDWTGAHSIRVYKVSTSQMNDYDRNGTGGNNSRFGPIKDLDATTEELTLKRDRSFTFAVDKLDTDETAQQVAAASALARQNREITIPEVDSYVYGVMAENAGTKLDDPLLTSDTIYDEITRASDVLDDAEVPETERVLVVSPYVYRLMKLCPHITMDSDIGQEQRLKGVIAFVDGAAVVKVPSVRLPESFAFMLVHPSATVAPVKLEDYRIHKDPPGISGDLVEGRVCYDAFVLENKKKAIYYRAVTGAVATE